MAAAMTVLVAVALFCQYTKPAVAVVAGEQAALLSKCPACLT